MLTARAPVVCHKALAIATATFSGLGQIFLDLAVTLLVVYISVVATQLAVLTDYFLYLAEYAAENSGFWLILQFLAGIYLYGIFAALYYQLVMAAAPIGWDSPVKHSIDWIARVVMVTSPTVAFAFLTWGAARSAPGGSWLMWLACATLMASAILQIAFAVVFRLKSSGKPSARPRFSPLLMIASLALASILYYWMWVDVIGAAKFLGGFGTILLFLICLLLFFIVLNLLKIRAATAAGWSIFIIAIGHAIGSPPPEFAYSTVALREAKNTSSASIEELAAKRDVPNLPSSFEQWILSRPQFQMASENRKYPVFIVAAQGGGQYAAYHTALSLARLYDRCPRLKDHVFAISSVSGGSFGAAMFAELLNRLPPREDRCSLQPRSEQPLEELS